MVQVSILFTQVNMCVRWIYGKMGLSTVVKISAVAQDDFCSCSSSARWIPSLKGRASYPDSGSTVCWVESIIHKLRRLVHLGTLAGF